MPSLHLLYIQWSRVVTWLPFQVSHFLHVKRLQTNRTLVGRSDGLMNGEYGRWMVSKIQLKNANELQTQNYRIKRSSNVTSLLCCHCWRTESPRLPKIWLSNDWQRDNADRNADVTSPELDCRTCCAFPFLQSNCSCLRSRTFQNCLEC